MRADAGFAVPALYEYCEEEGVAYTVGLITNPRLEELAEDLCSARPRNSTRRPGAASRGSIHEAPYQAGSWERARRAVYKAEAMEKGTNTRLVVTLRGMTIPRNSTNSTPSAGRARTGSRTSSCT